jgi:hypothetical protein
MRAHAKRVYSGRLPCILASIADFAAQINLSVIAILLAILLVGHVALADDAPPNFRTPSNDTELRYWLENMVAHHGFSVDEVHAATGISKKTLQAKLSEWKISKNSAARRDGLLTLPFPGGRHPRIGFLEGAIRPQRESKVSVFTPWAKHDYVVVDVPEAIWSNLGLTYLAHTHVPTVWTKQGKSLERLEWTRLKDAGDFRIERVLPNGIRFGAHIDTQRDHVAMKLWLKNGTKQPLTGMRVQNCVMLKSASGFNQQTNENKLADGSFSVCHSPDKKRWIITAWEPLHRAWYNERCPCLHSDPKFPDCAPGQTVEIQGWLSFFEGTDIKRELARIRKLWPVTK